MAVIYRKTLTGQAKEIADKAIGTARLTNQNLIALNQQRNMLEAQAQSLSLSFNQTLNRVNQNIYTAQRQSKAQQAALGMGGDVANLRAAGELQQEIANELDYTIGQAEQEAVNIAGQQSAINQAEVQAAGMEIMDAYANQLITEGGPGISRDRNREAWNIATGVFGGAIQGALSGLGLSFGAGKLGSGGGWFTKALGGASIGAGLVSMANQIESTVKIAQRGFQPDVYGQQERDLRDYNTNIKPLVTGSLLGIPAAIGLGTGLTQLGLQRKATGLEQQLSKLIDVPSGTARAARSIQIQSKLDPIAGKLSKFTTPNKFAQKISSGKIGKWGPKAFNPWMIAGFAALGGILGGIGGAQAKYKLDYNQLMTSDIAQQFSEFGLDLTQMEDIVYNK